MPVISGSASSARNRTPRHRAGVADGVEDDAIFSTNAPHTRVARCRCRAARRCEATHESPAPDSRTGYFCSASGWWNSTVFRRRSRKSRLKLARRAVDERRADIVAPGAFVLVRVAGEDVLAAVGVGEEDARDLRYEVDKKVRSAPLVLDTSNSRAELDGRSERVCGLDDVQERLQGHLQPRPHGKAVSIRVAHDVN